jgi:poly-beta-1,6-N-acetyl-D-glucosamine synthase
MRVKPPPTSPLPRPSAPALHRPPLHLPYLPVAMRFWIGVAAGLAWAALSAWIARPWIGDLGDAIGTVPAIAVIAGIAIVPGYLNLQLVTSLLLDRQSPLRDDVQLPPLAVLVAAFNEERTIAKTIAYALAQDYPAPFEVVVIDDGSDDDTAAIVRRFGRIDRRVRLISARHGGKASALNAGLATADAPAVATIDADTLLMPGALRRVVGRLLLSPPDTTAVAGCVLVGNSRASALTSAQEWDYFLGISSIKREQALLQGTLVAQGAFSVYDTAALRRVGGWPDRIGEDIVLTWALLREGGRTGFEPTAVAFTQVPIGLRAFMRQRRRWARGMIEGLRTHGGALLGQLGQRSHSVLGNLVFPYLDVTFTLAVPPGIVLACLGHFLIIGPLTLAVLPLNAAVAGIMFFRQRAAFSEAGLRVRRNVVGFALYFLLYQLVMAPTSVAGYAQEAFGVRRRW